MGKTIGGIFLVVGICIGAGILALPVMGSTSGFFPSSALMLFCWAFMTFNALLILEVNLWLPKGSNIISMAKSTLGIAGEMIAWFCYLFLFYSLLAAYISAGADISNSLLQPLQVGIPEWTEATIFTFALGFVVYLGTQKIDYFNRFLVCTKFVVFFLLVSFIVPHIKMPLLLEGHPKTVYTSLMVMITSFGFASIIPSLCDYFDRDPKRLRFVIIIGSLIPLGFYILWDFVILGALPLEGSDGLLHVLHSGHTTSQLILSIRHHVGNHWVTSSAQIFSSVCVTSSFLGVALALSDFLSDGFKIEKKNKGSIIIYGATFLPPLLTVLFYPTAFIMALNYAGTFCTILLAILPGLMVWRGRYHLQMGSGFKMPGGKPMLILVLSMAFIIALIGFGLELHYL